MSEQWIPTSERRPDQGQRVDWIAPDGSVIAGGEFSGGAIWLLPGGEMYVYYTPPFWRPAKEAPTHDLR